MLAKTGKRNYSTTGGLLFEWIQLVMPWVVFLFGFSLAKHLKERCFLEYCDTQNLQDCVETGVDVETFFYDGDEQID